MVSLELVKSIEAFRELTDEQVAMIKDHCEICEYDLGDKLFREGDESKHLWIVIQGQVDLRFEMPDMRPSSGHQTISKVDVEEQKPEAKVLGWSCFIPPHKMRLSAYCATDLCKIIRIKKDALLDIFSKHPEIGYKFLQYLITVVGFRFHQFQDHVAKGLGEDLMSGW